MAEGFELNLPIKVRYVPTSFEEQVDRYLARYNNRLAAPIVEDEPFSITRYGGENHVHGFEVQYQRKLPAVNEGRKRPDYPFLTHALLPETWAKVFNHIAGRPCEEQVLEYLTFYRDPEEGEYVDNFGVAVYADRVEIQQLDNGPHIKQAGEAIAPEHPEIRLKDASELEAMTLDTDAALRFAFDLARKLQEEHP